METAPAGLSLTHAPHPHAQCGSPGSFYQSPAQEKGRRTGLSRCLCEAAYCAGFDVSVDGAMVPPEDEPEPVDGAAFGAVGAGFIVLSVEGAAGAVVAGGVVLCVVWLSVPPLSLQAARPSKAIAETDARMIFFIVLLLSKLARFPPSVTGTMAAPYFRFVTLGYRMLQLSPIQLRHCPRRVYALQNRGSNSGAD
jgi:hypothetical protein